MITSHGSRKRLLLLILLFLALVLFYITGQNNYIEQINSNTNLSVSSAHKKKISYPRAVDPNAEKQQAYPVPVVERRITSKSIRTYNKLITTTKLDDFYQLFSDANDFGPFDIRREEHSEWESEQSNKHYGHLAEKKYDLIVLPVQLREHCCDRVSTMMSARWMAKEIESLTDHKVMSPELAQRLLGERKRNFDVESITKLAQESDADIVLTYLFNKFKYDGDAEDNKLLVVLVNSAGEISKLSHHDLQKVTPEMPLEDIIRQMSPKIAKELFSENHSNEPEPSFYSSNHIATYNLPVNLDRLLNRPLSPIENATYLQLFALLSPSILSYERDRIFERSLMALDDVNPSVPNYNLLKARALFYLTRKPLAVKILEDPLTPSELGFMAYMSGNYPDLKHYVEQINEPLLKVMGFIELKEVQYEYSISDEYDISDSLKEEYWKNLVRRIARDKDRWFVEDNISFFSSIRGLYKEFDGFYDKSITAHFVSGEMDYSENSDPILEKVLYYGNLGFAQTFCCLEYTKNLEINDIWRLYRNLALSNTLRSLERSINVHASYSSAYKKATKLEPILSGHPIFTRLYAQATQGMASKKTGKEKEFYYEKAISLADKVIAYSGAADFDVLSSELVKKEILEVIPKFREKYKYSFMAIESMDVPRGNIVLAKRVYSANSAKALPYDHTNFNILKYTAHSEEWSDEKLIEFLVQRYKGHPERASFLANKMIESNRSNEAINLLKSVILKDSTDWNAHDTLGKLLIRKSEYIDAEKVYSSYSGFLSDAGSQRVDLSNKAYDAGNRFYWRGRHEEAKKFYSIAGSIETGAESGYASLQRLAMMSHDYQTALRYSFRRGKRYNSRYGYRDYLAMLHLLGEHEEAVSGFTSLVSRYDSPPVWTSLLIGQRIQNSSQDIYRNLVGDVLKNSPEFMQLQAARYVFLSKVTDRLPSENDLQEFPEILSDSKQYQIANSIIKKIREEHELGNPSLNCENGILNCGGNTNNSSDIPANISQFNKYKNYLEAYISFKNSKYEQAFNQYLKNDEVDSILSSDTEYNKNGKLNSILIVNHSLPYLAMSALMSDKDDFLESLKKNINGKHLTKESAFDILLTESIISASEEQWDISLDFIKKAFNRRPHTKWRPMYSWYQITEITEWLYLLSKDRRFIDLALEWVKDYQVIQPQFSWAYAFEALYGTNRQDKIKSAAFAFYLDRDSYWLSKVPYDIKRQGIEWWKTNNPFKIRTMNQQGAESI
ncbi:MAG: hypothetical protein JAY85_13540 [Candidatus Thiodiazotropha weberae]|uniref:Tetratricopeptide repeat protein n=1 Tax=Candidatus Thiodiazotropha endoloripes TaxID=1818881 RepID=A0A1E2UT65_9GAMM|nr:hypothetical protein [Candidatus Thiodiazotropha endoloripes]MCG7899466.1 hypothetical protein [Candidatus Thiodiazotropha weberae]ODB86722.1 hypothetical protein A3195_14175 [Candidatus Thiodiazotropha endoloripes]ODB97861.1 hypothetical protein A3196_14510 [Candidatus Thiodiazotropha endoloripes]